MSNFFTRENILKIFVAGLVLVFLLELFSLSPSNVGGGNAPSTQIPPAETVSTTAGIGLANATIIAYSADFVVSGGTGTAAKIASLRDRGLILYANVVGNSTVINLAKDANGTQVAEELVAVNATVLSRSTLRVQDPVTFQTDAGPMIASVGRTLPLYIDPSIPVGEVVQIGIIGEIKAGSVVSLESPKLVPIDLDTILNVTVATGKLNYRAALALPWAARTFNASAANGTQNNNPQLVGLSWEYRPANAILLDSPPSSAVADKLRNLSFVVSLNGTRLVVTENFTDEAAARAKLGALLGENTSLLFPQSYLIATFTAGNETSGYNFTGSEFSAFQYMQLATQRLFSVRIPAKMEIAGKTYTNPRIPAADVYLTGATVGDSQQLLATVSVVGNRVVAVKLLS